MTGTDRHETVMIAVERDGKVLLARRLGEPSKGLFAIPGGHVDEGEGPPEAALREASEEIPGTDVLPEELTSFLHGVPEGEKRHPGPHEHLCHLFRGRLEGPVRTASDAGEPLWLTPEEALKRDDIEESGSTRYALVWLMRNPGLS